MARHLCHCENTIWRCEVVAQTRIQPQRLRAGATIATSEVLFVHSAAMLSGAHATAVETEAECPSWGSGRECSAGLPVNAPGSFSANLKQRLLRTIHDVVDKCSHSFQALRHVWAPDVAEREVSWRDRRFSGSTSKVTDFSFGTCQRSLFVPGRWESG